MPYTLSKGLKNTHPNLELVQEKQVLGPDIAYDATSGGYLFKGTRCKIDEMSCAPEGSGFTTDGSGKITVIDNLPGNCGTCERCNH